MQQPEATRKSLRDEIYAPVEDTDVSWAIKGLTLLLLAAVTGLYVYAAFNADLSLMTR